MSQEKDYLTFEDFCEISFEFEYPYLYYEFIYALSGKKNEDIVCDMTQSISPYVVIETEATHKGWVSSLIKAERNKRASFIIHEEKAFQAQIKEMENCKGAVQSINIYS